MIKLKDLLTESPKLETLKKNKVPLSKEERDEAIKLGATWDDQKTCGIWKSIVNGKTWYGCNTHRAFDVKPTLKGAVKAFEFIKTTS